MSTHQPLSACLLGFWFCSSVHCQQDLPAIADSHISSLYPVNKDKKVKELIIQVTWAFFTGNIAAIQINISLIYKAHDDEFWFNNVSIHEDHFRQNAVLTWFYIKTAKMISQARHKKYFVCICRPMNFLRVSRSASFFLFAKCKNSPNATIFYIKWQHCTIRTNLFSSQMVYPKYVGGKANSVDPDQTALWSSLIWVCTFCSGLSVIHYTTSGDLSKFAI